MIRATGFSFNGFHIDSFDVTHISAGSGIQDEQWTGEKVLNVWKTNYGKKENVKSIEKEALEIPVSLYFDGNLTFHKEQEIKNWLMQENYCKLIFDDEPNVEYYAQVKSAPTLKHNTVDSGYVNFVFKTNSYYRFSNKVVFEGVSNSDTQYTELYLTCDSYVEVDTFIEVTSPQVTDLEFWNEETGVRSILYGTYVNLSADFSSEYEEIYSEARYTPTLYDAHNGNFIKLVKGKNKIKIKGKCQYKITYQNIYL